MIYRIYSQKDATIYEQNLRKNQNTGADEILEVTKFFDTDYQRRMIGNSRILLQFDISDVSQSIVSGDIPANVKYYLRLASTEQNEVQAVYDLNVYQVSQSWDEGIGQFYYDPKVTDGVSWVYRSGTTTWNVSNPQVFNENPAYPVPTTGIVLYEGFATSDTGSAYLTESINDINGNSPTAFVENNKLVISASNYAGTTLVFPAELEASQSYKVQFQIQPDSFDTIDFKIQDPNGVLRTDEDYSGMVNIITSSMTQSFAIDTGPAGTYNFRFAFFDNQGTYGANTISTGSFDEIYVYKVGTNILIWDTFALNKGNFFLGNVIKNTANELPRLFASESKLNFYADNIGGGSAMYRYELATGKQYTISSEIELGDFPEIGFKIYSPLGTVVNAGLSNYTASYTTSATQSMSIVPQRSGVYTFEYSFFDSGSTGASGSLDNFKIILSSGSLNTPQMSAASYVTSSGGATWYTASYNNTSYSQRFNKYTNDLNVEVSEYVRDWMSGSRDNHGMIVKRPYNQETGSVKYGSSKFFSMESHTIYPPLLELKWDDSSFSTGSLAALTADNIVIYPKNLNSEYKETSKARIRLVGREKYPARTFTNSNPYNVVKYLPQTTYYQVRDVQSDLVLIPFDTTYTKVSCDSTGSYFDFWFNSLQPERFYQFEIRVDQNGKVNYYDGFVFKVVR